jgi:stearoyl-CoA desaturase (delta-9 desaturase)
MTSPGSTLPKPAALPVPDLKTAAARAFCGRQHKYMWEQVALGLFIVIPLAAVLAAGFVAWGWGLGYRDVIIGAAMYWISGHGITVGFHRYFTHGSFKAKRPLRIAMAVAGTLAIQGPVIRWVADHRKHHAFSD